MKLVTLRKEKYIEEKHCGELALGTPKLIRFVGFVSASAYK